MDPLILLSNYLVGQPSRMDFLDSYEGDVLKEIHLKTIPTKLMRKKKLILEYDLTIEELFYLGYYIVVGSPIQGEYFKLKDDDLLFSFSEVSRLLSCQEIFIQRAYYNDDSKEIYEVLLQDFEEAFWHLASSKIELNQYVERLPAQQESHPPNHEEITAEEDSNEDQSNQQNYEELMQRIEKLQLDLEMIDNQLADEDSDEEEINQEEKKNLNDFPPPEPPIQQLINSDLMDKTSDDELQQENNNNQYEVSTQYVLFQLPDFNQYAQEAENQQQYQQQPTQQSDNQLNQSTTLPPPETYQANNSFQPNDQRNRPQTRLAQIIIIRSAIFIGLVATLQLSEKGARSLSQIRRGKTKVKLIKQLIIKKPSKKKRRLTLIFTIITIQPKPLTLPNNKLLLIDQQRESQRYLCQDYMNQAQRNLPSNFLKILSEKPTNTDRVIIDSRRESPTIRKKLQGPQMIQTNFLQRKNLLNKSASNLSQFITSQEIISPSNKNIPSVTTLPRTLESSSKVGESIQESPELIDFSTVQNRNLNQDESLEKTQVFKKQSNKVTDSNMATNGSQFPIQVFQSVMVDSRTFVKEELIDYKESILQVQFNIIKYFDNKPNLHLSRRPKIISTQHQLIALRYLITDNPISLPFDLNTVLLMEDKSQLIIVLPDISNLESIKSQLSSLYIYDLRQNNLIQSPSMEKRKFIITRINSSQQAFAITHVKPKEWISLIQYIRKQNVTELISNQNVYLYLPLQQGKLAVFSEKPSSTQLDNLFFHEDKYEWK